MFSSLTLDPKKINEPVGEESNRFKIKSKSKRSNNESFDKNRFLGARKEINPYAESIIVP